MHSISCIRRAAHTDLNSPNSEYSRLKAISMTSHLFRILTQPLLFERIRLIGKVREALFVAKQLHNMFTSREDSARWIQHLSIHCDTPAFAPSGGFVSDNTKEQEELADLVAKLLPRMHNLRNLGVEQLKLPLIVYSQLYQLPRLKAVSFGWAVFDQVHVGTLSDLDVNSLTISDLTIPRPFSTAIGTFAPPSIYRLARSPYLRSLCTSTITAEELPHIIGTSNTCLMALTTLIVNESSSPFAPLVSLAPNCPNLHTLSLGVSSAFRFFRFGLAPAVNLPPSISSDVWPLLGKFSGCLRVAQLLVPGRPVENIKIMGGLDAVDEWDRRSLFPLGQGSTAVKEFAMAEMPWREDGIEDIAAVLPDLETLEITFKGEHQVGLFCGSLWTLR